MPIIILTATAFEQQKLREQLTHPAQQTIAHTTWTRGLLDNCPVVLIETGIGLVNTAHALAVALQQIHPDLVIQTGIGGAYLRADLSIGDLVLATSENYGELGVITPKGWYPAEEIGIPLLTKDEDHYNTYPLDTTLVTDAQNALENEGEVAPLGAFVTVQQCSGQTVIGNTLAKRFNAICENMEGVAAAQLCLLYDVPFLELRAISNQVENRNKKAWNIPLSLERAQDATRKLIAALK